MLFSRLTPVHTNYVKKVNEGHAQIQRGEGTGGLDLLKNHKNIGFLTISNTGPDPLKIIKLLSQIQYWAIIGPPAKGHLNGVSL